MRANEDGPATVSEQDLPAGASSALRRQLNALRQIEQRVCAVAKAYLLFTELARRDAFAATIDETPAAWGATLVVGSLARDVIVGLASIFDTDDRATNLLRVVNELLKSENCATLETFHAQFPVPVGSAARESRERLKRYRSVINRKRYQAALTRVRDLRMKAVAHTDLQPVFAKGKPQIREIGLLLGYTAIATNEACFYGLGRRHDLQDAQKIWRKGATAFTACLAQGSVVPRGT